MKVDISGLEQALRSIAKLPIEDATEKKALRKGAQVIQKAVQQNIVSQNLIDEGILAENIKLKTEEGQIIVHTGRAYHAHLVEGGRSGGSKMAKKNGKLQRVTWGSTSARVFFSSAWESKKAESLQAMADEIRKELRL